MLQLKNVREVVREDNDEPTGVVVTQVIEDQKFIVYASTSKLCQLKYINISHRWLFLRGVGKPTVQAKLFRYIFLGLDFPNEIISIDRSQLVVW